MKRLVALLLVICIITMYVPFYGYAENEYVIHDSGYVPRNQNFATREEAVANFIKASGIDVSGVSANELKIFKDYGKIASVYSREIATAIKNQVVYGYEDQTFRPQGAIVRVEALVILNRILKDWDLPKDKAIKFEDTPIWAEDDIKRLTSAGIVKGYGDGRLGANDYLTSEQVALLADRAARIIGPMGDYYNYINSLWIAETDLPEGYSMWSDYTEISQKINKEIGDIVYGLYRRKNRDHEEFLEGSCEQKIADMFTVAANSAYREKLGITPVKEYINTIEKAKDTEDILIAMTELEKVGFKNLLSFSVTKDFRNSKEYVLSYSECYTGFGKAEDTTDISKEEQNAYNKYISDLFILSGKTDADADGVTDLCVKLQKASLTNQDRNKIEKKASFYSKEEWQDNFPNIKLNKLLKQMELTEVNEVLVYNKPLLDLVNDLLVDENVDLLKDYMLASVMDTSAKYLNNEAFAIWRDYRDKLSGVKSGAITADYAVNIVEELLGWELSKLYINEYSNATDKKSVENMTWDILNAYKSRLRRNKWLSASSLGVAIKKIENISIKVGYPDNIDDYINLEYKIKSAEDGGNLIQYRADYWEQYYKTSSDALKGKLENSGRSSWNILPYRVNAMYDPSTNSITIPMALIRKPFYDSKASYESNLGGIGVIIAHEISHSLDQLGSKFDENGNMQDWWGSDDKEKFMEICHLVEDEYSKIEFIPGLKVDGKHTLNENLADIAAMQCVIDIAGEGNRRLGDMFENYAICWRAKSTDAYKRGMLKKDNHAPDKVRVNRVLSNFDSFLDYYDVREGDGMYLDDNRKIKIW